MHRPVARLGSCTGPPAQHSSRRVLRIQRIRFAAPPAIRPVHPIHVQHVHSLRQQIARQGRPPPPRPASPHPTSWPTSANPGTRPQWPGTHRLPALPRSRRAPQPRGHPGAYPLPVPPPPQDGDGEAAARATYWARSKSTCRSPSSPTARRVAGTGPRQTVRIVKTPRQSAGPYRDTPRRPGTDNAPSPTHGRHCETRTRRSEMSGARPQIRDSTHPSSCPHNIRTRGAQTRPPTAPMRQLMFVDGGERARDTAVTNAMRQPCVPPWSDLLICAAIHRLGRIMQVKTSPRPTTFKRRELGLSVARGIPGGMATYGSCQEYFEG